LLFILKVYFCFVCLRYKAQHEVDTMKRFSLVILVTLSLLGCNTTNNNSCGYAFVGGEIVNPINDHLVLYDNIAPIDTLYLDDDNRFSFEIESLNPGLHSLVHGGEYQVILLEANDSLMLRLNTLDFDESLVFTGVGAKKNNYLINLSNTLESESQQVYKFSKSKPDVFLTSIDSLKNEKINRLESFKSKYESSSLFNLVANANINYSYATHKELYPFRYFGKNDLRNRSQLPENFYNFRKNVNYNDEMLKDFYPYYNFLFPHFNNLALDRYFEATKDTVFDKNAIEYHLNKLDLMDKLVQHKDIKNNLLKYATRNFLSYNNSDEDCDAMFQSFEAKSSNQEHLDYISGLYQTILKLRPGNTFPAIEVLDFKNQVHNMNAMFEGPTVVYFWSHAIKNHFKNSHLKVANLKKAFPDIKFVSININADKLTMWKRLLYQHNFSLDGEYRFRDAEAAKKILAIHYINKVMVVGQNNQIITSNANMFSNEFKGLLNEL